MDKEMMKGSIDILILSVLNGSDSYGYEIVKSLKQQTDNVYDMSEGTLYPALKRLENKGFVESYWGEANEGGRRKYYHLNQNGKKELNRKVNQWRKINKLVSRVTEGLT